LTNNDLKQINNIYSRIEEVTRPSLAQAFAYANVNRGQNGGEDWWSHFHDLRVLNYTRPFHRTIDGSNHSHLVIDVDVRTVNQNVEARYANGYLEELRKLKIGAALDYFKGWSIDRGKHQFLWKVGGTGLHAIQRIDQRVNRRTLLNLFTSVLFPMCDKIKDVHDAYPIDSFKKRHKCSNICFGWHYPYEFKAKQPVPFVYRNDLKYIKYHRYKNINFRLEIDLNFVHQDKKTLRWIYSPYFGIKGRIYYSIPIKVWNLNWVMNHSVAEGLIVEPFDIPKFSFGEYVNFDEIDEETWVQNKKPNIKDSKGSSSGTSINVMDVKLKDIDAVITPSYQRLLDGMTRYLTKDNCSPCMKKFYFQAKNQKGMHWQRFPILRYLAAQGYDKHQIANWIRFHLNNKYHNLPENRHKLLSNLPAVLNESHVPTCETMQTSGHKFFVCDPEMRVRCGRTSPLQTKRLNETIANFKVETAKKKLSQTKNYPKTKKEVENHWKPSIKILHKAIKTRENLVIHKSTRAGVTTNMIYLCFLLGIKLLVLVPYNKISKDTIGKASNLVKEKTGRYPNVAVLAKNDESCLELKLWEKRLQQKKRENPNWGDNNSQLAWSRLQYRGKDSCKNCRFLNSTVSLPVIEDDKVIPIFSSVDTAPDDPQARSGWCAYQTIKQNIHEIDVLVMTYTKMQTLREAKTKENSALLDVIMRNFNLVFLDEISKPAGNGTTINVLKHPEQPHDIETELDYDIFRTLKDELIQLDTHFPESKPVRAITEIIQKFIMTFEGMKLLEWRHENVITNSSYHFVSDTPSNPQYQHPLDYQEREDLKVRLQYYHKTLESYSRATNKGLFQIEKVLMLLSRDSFFGHNLPTYRNKFLDYSFVVSPSILELRGFVNDYIRENPDGQLIVTDATPPVAPISDLLGIPFRDFLVGDPRKTNEYQLVMADKFQVYPNDLMKAAPSCSSYCEYWDKDEKKCTNIFKFNQWYKGSWRNRVRTALLSNGKCLKLQFELANEIKGVIQAFGAENIFLIFSNIAVYRWFTKFWLRKMPKYGNLKHTYYRSEWTVGVDNSRRFVFTVGPPATPTNSSFWLAYYYHYYGLLPQYSLADLAERLRQNNMQSAYWQTIGRGKDPLGKDRSVVFSWGLSENTLEKLLDFHPLMRESLPKHIKFDSRTYKQSSVMQILTIWRNYGILIGPYLVKILNTMVKRGAVDRWISQRDMYNKYSLSYKVLEQVTSKYGFDKLKQLGLHIKSQTWGGKERFLFWYALTKQPDT
jgi:hypothetical protein